MPANSYAPKAVKSSGKTSIRVVKSSRKYKNTGYGVYFT
jgi:hypothetical protein